MCFTLQNLKRPVVAGAFKTNFHSSHANPSPFHPNLSFPKEAVLFVFICLFHTLSGKFLLICALTISNFDLFKRKPGVFAGKFVSIVSYLVINAEKYETLVLPPRGGGAESPRMHFTPILEAQN